MHPKATMPTFPAPQVLRLYNTLLRLDFAYAALRQHGPFWLVDVFVANGDKPALTVQLTDDVLETLKACGVVARYVRKPD